MRKLPIRPSFAKGLIHMALVGSALTIAGTAWGEQCELKQDDIKRNSNLVTLYAQLVVNHDDITKTDHDNVSGEYVGYGFGSFERQSGGEVRANLERILGIRLDYAEAVQLLANYVSDNARLAYISCIEHQEPTPLLAYADPEDQSNRRIRIRWMAVGGQKAQKVVVVFRYKDANGNLIQEADVSASGDTFSHQIDRPWGQDRSVDVWVYKNNLRTTFLRNITGNRYGVFGRLANTSVNLPIALTTSIKLVDAPKIAAPIVIEAIDEWGEHGEHHQVGGVDVSGGEGTLVDINNLKGQSSNYNKDDVAFSCRAPSLKFNPSSDYAPVVTVTPSVNPGQLHNCPAMAKWVLQPLLKVPTVVEMDFGHEFK